MVALKRAMDALLCVLQPTQQNNILYITDEQRCIATIRLLIELWYIIVYTLQ